MILRELTPLDKDAYLKYVKSWGNESMVPSNTNYDRYENYEEMLTTITLAKTANEDYEVPHTTLFLFHENEILGAVNIRFYLNNSFKKDGGHISYGVSPLSRGRGYAAYMTRFGLDYLESLGVEHVLLTSDANNTPSIKNIIRNGGREVESYSDEKRHTRRFWVKINH